MYRKVSFHAFLNAGERADEDKCYPGTRKEVINRMEKGRDSENTLYVPKFWVSGTAGAGIQSLG